MSQNLSFRIPPPSPPSSTVKPNYKQNFFSALEQLNSLEKNHWVWLECNYFLKYTPDKKNVSYLNLTPFHKIHNMMGSVQTTLAYPQVEISMEKNIIFDHSLGWNWHKSWILPMITVKLLNYQDFDLEENKIFAKLFVVKAGLQETETFYLVDIGMKGANKVYLKNNIASFNNVKFASTSYNNEGLKFHLVVALFFEINNSSDFSSTSNLRIIESKLSPPIYVDSRKSARDNFSFEAKIFDYFHPDLLVKALVKRRKKDGDISEDPISNNFKGFVNYYTAANIRNKVKHPFFPALRFSSCIYLYFNKEYFKNMELENIIEKILNLLTKFNDNISLKDVKCKKAKSKIAINNINENAYLTIFIKNPKDINFSKKVSEFLNSFDQRIINIVSNNNTEIQNLNKFQQITDLNILAKVYKEQYEKNATNSIKNNEEEDEDEDDEEPTEKSFGTSSSNLIAKDLIMKKYIKKNNISSSKFQPNANFNEINKVKTYSSEFALGQSSTPNQIVTEISQNSVKQENCPIIQKIEFEASKKKIDKPLNINNNVKQEEQRIETKEEVVPQNQQEIFNTLNFQNPFMSNLSGGNDQTMNLPSHLNQNKMAMSNSLNSFLPQNNNNFQYNNNKPLNMQNATNMSNNISNINMSNMTNISNMPPNMSNMQNLSNNMSSIPNNMSNIPYNRSTIPNMNNMTNMSSISNMSNMANLSNISNRTNMTNMTNMANMNNMSNIANMTNMANMANMTNLNVANMQNMTNIANMTNNMGMGRMFQTPQNQNMLNQMANLPSNMLNFNLNQQNSMNFFKQSQMLQNIQNQNIPNLMDQKVNFENPMNMSKNLIINQQIQQINNNNNLLLSLSQVQARKAQLANDILKFKNFL